MLSLLYMLSRTIIGKDSEWQWEIRLYATEKKNWWCKQNSFQNATFSQLSLFFCWWLCKHTFGEVWIGQKLRSFLFSRYSALELLQQEYFPDKRVCIGCIQPLAIVLWSVLAEYVILLNPIMTKIVMQFIFSQPLAYNSYVLQFGIKKQGTLS